MKIEPVLSKIIVYPIKSLDGVDCTDTRVLDSGAIVFDRTWALFDTRDGVVNGKRHASVHRLRATVDRGNQTISLRDESGRGLQPGTFALGEDNLDLEQWLATYFGFAVVLRRNAVVGHPDDLDSPGPTVISVATLREIGRWFGLSLEQIRARLRTNLEIDGVPAFWEDRLFGAKQTSVRFRIGDVAFDGINPCQRCVVPPRDPITGANDDSFVRRFVELRERTLPSWSTRDRFDHFYRIAINTRLAAETRGRTIRVGDRVEILGQSGQDGADDPSPRPSASDFWAGDLVVDAVRDEAPGVRTFRLRDPSRTALPFRFKPGQFLTVTARPDPGAIQRCYTIASSPDETSYCEITIKHEGQASGWLHTSVGPGARLAVSGPMGQFAFDDTAATPVLFLAGGVGITPLMSMLRTLAGRRWRGRADLIYSVRSSQQIIFQDELDTMRRTWPAFGLHVTVTGEDPGWSGPRGRLSADWVRSVVPDIARRHVRVCGPTALASAAQELLRGLGVIDDFIRVEAFGGRSRPPTDDAAMEDRQVRFARSECDAHVKAGETLLDAALAAGIPLDHGCRAGVCRRCEITLLDGDVMSDAVGVLTSAEKAARPILACQTRLLSNIVVDC